jgi:hypothetical protein
MAAIGMETGLVLKGGINVYYAMCTRARSLGFGYELDV